MRRRPARALAAITAAFAVLVAPLTLATSAQAAPGLTVTPLEWNVVGLDSNTPATGPSRFVIGAQVCNTGTTTLTDVTTTWVWDTASTAISLLGAATKAPMSLAPSACAKVWYSVDVVKAASSYNQTRRFHITAQATGATASTPVPREIYVEKLVSQNRNAITSITGPTTVYLGGTYTYNVKASTATNGYEQLSATPFLDPSIFEVRSVSKTMSVGGTDSTFYTDACGWQNDPTAAATYRSCAGSGKAGGTIDLTVVATVIGTGSGTIQAVIYDFSGSSYHYNSDFSTAVKSLSYTAVAPAAPVAVADAVTTAEDTPVTATLTANDTDADGDLVPGSVTVVTAPAHGTTGLAASGAVTYTPAANWSGTDSFTYQVCDSGSRCATATVTVTVTAANDLPVAVDDALTVGEDAPATVVPVLTNDTDVDGDTLAVGSVTQPANGTVTLVGGVVRYQPAPGWSGTDTFDYTVTDGNGGTDTGTVTVTVSPVNDAPVALADAATVRQDDPATEVDVRGNDSDVDGDALTVTAVTQPPNGTVTFTGTAVRYQPAPGFAGTDTFTYTVSDGNGGTATASVTVTVLPPADPENTDPAAADDALAVDEDAPATVVPVLGNDSDADGDTLLVTSVTQPAEGTVTLVGGVVSYQPAPGFSGTETFGYTITDGNGGTGSATVTVTVASVNDAPVAADDTLGVDEDAPATVVPVLGNDTDVDGDTLTVTAVTQPAEGTVVLDGGVVTYQPAAGWSGTTSFTYTVTDGAGGSDTATVTVTVAPVNDAPLAVDDALTVDEDAAATVVPVLGNDTDADGDALTVTGVTQPADGTAALVAGVVTYQPAPGFSGTETFEYSVADGQGGTATATVTVTVTPAPEPENGPPTADDDTLTVDEDAAATVVPVLVGDTDPDGDTLTVTAVTQPVSGTVTLGGGVVTYQPAPGFSGTETFTYTVSDGNGGTDSASVTVTVTPAAEPVNTAPVAADDSATVDQDDPATVVAVLGNDGDADGDTLLVSAVTQPAHGTASLVDGVVRYQPDAGWSGTDTFTYTITDGNGGTATATVTVTVIPAPEPGNTGPVANPDALELAQDAPATVVAVLGNDTDADGDALVVTSVTPAPHGTVTLDGGVVTYQPDAGWSGTDVFTYTITDGRGGTATATVTVTVVPVVPPANTAPVAVDDAITLPLDAPATVVPVLGNDTDADGDALAVVGVTQGAHGAVTLVDGVVRYQPAAGWSGTDTFTYTITDGNGGTATATVTVTVPAPPVPPTATDDAVQLPAGATSVVIGVLGNDGAPDGSVVTVVTAPGHGTAVVNPDGTITYTPTPGWSGTDTLVYEVCTPQGACATATVTVVVPAPVVPPVTPPVTRPVTPPAPAGPRPGAQPSRPAPALASTGADALGLSVASLALLLAGGLAVVGARRRSREH